MRKAKVCAGMLAICMMMCAGCGKAEDSTVTNSNNTVKEDVEVTQATIDEKETEEADEKAGGEESQPLEAPKDEETSDVISNTEAEGEATEVHEESTSTEEENTMKMDIALDCPESIYAPREGVEYPKAIHEVYHSNTTGLDRGVNILLPNGYSEEKQYPVLYLLHGIFGDEYTLINDAECRIPEITTNLVADGIAKEMIVVLPNMYAKTEESQAPGFSEAAVAPYDNFINDLVNDLIPYIEENYSVLEGRENRAIAGFSMGGRETLFIGINRPDLFGYIGAIAPAPGLTPAKDWAMTHKGQMQEDEVYIKDTEHMPYLLMVCCGTVDGTVGKFPLTYHELLEKNQVEHIWYEVPGADHNAQAIRSGLNNFVAAIFQAE